jgi:hypothetical protein
MTTPLEAALFCIFFAIGILGMMFGPWLVTQDFDFDLFHDYPKSVLAGAILLGIVIVALFCWSLT